MLLSELKHYRTFMSNVNVLISFCLIAMYQTFHFRSQEGDKAGNNVNKNLVTHIA